MSIALVIIINAQIFSRFVLFYSLPWATEASIYLFVAVIMLAGSLNCRDDSEIKIEAIYFKKEKSMANLNIVRDLLSIVILFIFIFSSLQLVQNSIERSQTISSLQLSYTYVFLLMPIGFSLMTLEKIIVLLKRIVSMRKLSAH